MKNVLYTTGIGVPHQTFEDEFLTHRGVSEWWYSTGYFSDETNEMFSFQYTLAHIKIFGIRFHMMLTAITDIQTGKHYYGQQIALLGKNVVTNLKETTFSDVASIKYAGNSQSSLGDMQLTIKGKEYQLSLSMQAQKSPVWHCEDGKLRMGIPDDPRQITYYFSFTNLKAEGTLVLEGKKHQVKGKTWFDKQGGTYQLTKPQTNWEWFSFRFCDEEEIMLFAFPQTGYRDGTYIKKSGQYARLNNYTIEPLGFITEPATKYQFSYGWQVKMPSVKEEEYLIKPKTDGQFNVFFYELLADIVNRNGEVAGYCFVELLPGARNKKLNSLLAFKKKS
jgi:predicted secreted hydrolase